MTSERKKNNVVVTPPGVETVIVVDSSGGKNPTHPKDRQQLEKRIKASEKRNTSQ